MSRFVATGNISGNISYELDLPEGVQIEDIAKFSMKWDEAFIELTDGRFFSVEMTFLEETTDTKWPTKVEICPVDDLGAPDWGEVRQFN
jgi:hypothetical protein